MTKKPIKPYSNTAWSAATTILSAAVFIYWYRDYAQRDYSESVGFPLVFYKFQGGINGAATDRFYGMNFAIDAALVVLAAAIFSWIVLKLLRRG